MENIEECIYILEQHQWNLQVRKSFIFDDVQTEFVFQTAVQEILERLGTPQENESTVPFEPPVGVASSVEPRPNNKRQSYPDQFNNFDELRTTRTIPRN